MKELFDRILQFAPSYFNRLLDILAGPKRFAAKQNAQDATVTKDALIFLSISLAIVFTLQIPLQPKKHTLLVTFGMLIAQELLLLVLSVVILRFTWLIVGGKVCLKDFFIITSYFVGAGLIICVPVDLLADGLLKNLDPVLYDFLMDDSLPLSLYYSLPTSMHIFFNHSSGFMIYGVISGLSLIAVYAWSFITWGTYREMCKVSKARSGIAFVVYNIVSIPLLILALFLPK